ncbi:MAG: signal peptide peptidase SppA [Bdellovibrionales bacterium]|nr:signal peptide peptidase SppA [Bdellovibrionales bacterium]
MKGLLRALAGTAIVCVIVIIISITIGIFRLAVSGGGGGAREDHVAVLNLEGVILDASDFLRRVEEVKDNDYAKAVVVSINSPGGVVGPSQEFFESLKKLDEKKPVIISMGAVAASGGYYAALGGRKIYANPGTLTASIGVIMEFLNTEKLYNWAKIERFTLKAGKLKDVGSPNRPMKPEEKAFLNTLLADIHAQFKTAVQTRRGLSDAEMEDTTDGRIMTGQQALKAKLVDALGGLADAVAEARAVAKLPEDAPVHYPRPPKGMLEKYFFGETLSGIGEVLGVLQSTQPFALRSGWQILLLAPLY